MREKGFEGIKRRQKDKRKMGGKADKRVECRVLQECRRSQGYLALHWHAEINWSVSYCGPAEGRRN